MAKTKKQTKTSYQYYEEVKSSLSIEHIIHAPNENTVEGILVSLTEQFEQHSGTFEDGTFNNEIKSCLDEILHLMFQIQEGGTEGIPPDTIVVLFFRLGIAIGRQEGLGYLAPLVRKLSDLMVEEVKDAKAGLLKGAKQTSDKYSYPARLAKRIILQYALKLPRRLNHEKIDRGVKADLKRSIIQEFDLEKYKEETGNNQIPTEQTIVKRINETLTDLGYQ